MSNTIGTITVEAGETRKTYETASWYTTFEYPAQTVDLVAHGQWVTYTLEGRNTYEFFPSSFGGRIFGGRIGEIDEPSTHTVQLYDYIVAGRVAEGDDSIRLADGWVVESHDREHEVTCQGYSYEKNPDGPQALIVPCGHTGHHNHRGDPVEWVEARGDRWPRHLDHGYIDGVTKTVTHHRIRQEVAA